MKRIILFIFLSFLPVWAACFWLMSSSAALLLYGGQVFLLCMFAPSAAMLLTRFFTKEGFSDIRLRPHWKGNFKWYLAAWFGPSALIAAGAALWFLLNPGRFDPTCSAFAGLAKGADMPRLILTQAAVGILAGPLINFIPALGEEAGWRGYLLPRLQKALSPRLAVVVSGVIWGVWHAPMIALGHNYGTGYAGYPWAGIAAMTIFCVAVGSFLALLATRTRSALPCALAHGGLNAMASVGIYFAAGETSPFVGPLPTGIIGGAGFLVLGAVLLFTAPRWAAPSFIEQNALGFADE